MKNLEKYLIKFEELEVGQNVWSPIIGECEIKTLGANPIHPIHIIGDDEGYFNLNPDGRIDKNDKYPFIYLSNPFEQVNEYPKWMMVSDCEITEETDEEYQERIKIEETKKQEYSKFQEKQELAEYERLKAKFEGK